jgi:hypothetical protein
MFHDPMEKTSKQHTIWHELVRTTVNIGHPFDHIVCEVIWFLDTKTVEHMGETRRDVITVACKAQHVLTKKEFPTSKVGKELFEVDTVWVKVDN